MSNKKNLRKSKRVMNQKGDMYHINNMGFLNFSPNATDEGIKELLDIFSFNGFFETVKINK